MASTEKLALEKAIDFIESLTRDPLLLPDDIEMTLADVQAHARIELASIRKVLDASPQEQMVRKAEAFDRIVAARKKHIDAGKAYNARRELVEAERSRGNWGIKLDVEYRAMSDAQSEYHRTVQELADAALTTEGQP